MILLLISEHLWLTLLAVGLMLVCGSADVATHFSPRGAAAARGAGESAD